ncbi:MAG TPA: low molecular weight protein-tyrosine-phosphatase [Kineosporiaceae bacterium]|nr:low molecular weight protein-tyrosine-phosphatase [Kineosporiaceae bacterium]
MAHPGPYRVCFVCSGNICRSPMAEAVLCRMVDQAGLADRVTVDSAGTGDWHIGERADRRAVQALVAADYPDLAHRARQFEVAWFAERDLVIALDRGHLRTLRAWAPSESARAKVHLLRSFDPQAGPEAARSRLDVPDPYYDGPAMFAEVLRLIEAAAAGLLARVAEDLDLPPVQGVAAH